MQHRDYFPLSSHFYIGRCPLGGNEGEVVVHKIYEAMLNCSYVNDKCNELELKYIYIYLISLLFVRLL